MYRLEFGRRFNNTAAKALANVQSDWKNQIIYFALRYFRFCEILLEVLFPTDLYYHETIQSNEDSALSRDFY